MISIAGTGAITYVCRPERFTRVSGWGPLLGDEGSGYDLGRRALQTACRIFDGREAPDDVFAREIFSFMGAEDPRDLLLLLNQGDIRSKTATAARPSSACMKRATRPPDGCWSRRRRKSPLPYRPP